jgi:hypothetical protein
MIGLEVERLEDLGVGPEADVRALLARLAGDLHRLGQQSALALDA